jgi:hypothetical protein
MSVIERVRDLELELKSFFKPDDLKVIENLLLHEKPDLALEVICDQLINYQSHISEAQVHELQTLTHEMNLEPEFTWQEVVFIDIKTKDLRKLFNENSKFVDMKLIIGSIVDDVEKYLKSEETKLIREFLGADEPDLAVDSLFGALEIQDVPFSKQTYKNLKKIATCFGLGEKYCEKFTVKDSDVTETDVETDSFYEPVSSEINEELIDIITDPGVPWKQITGQGHWRYNRTKYFADGFRDGKWIRVVFEDNFRGILAAYPLDSRDGEQYAHTP